MSSGEDNAGGVGVGLDAIDRIVFARGAWSVLMAGDVLAEGEAREGRALPDLLRRRWAIRATVATGNGTYFILTRREDEERAADPLTASAAPRLALAAKEPAPSWVLRWGAPVREARQAGPHRL
jgi:hypothetical protein